MLGFVFVKEVVGGWWLVVGGLDKI